MDSLASTVNNIASTQNDVRIRLEKLDSGFLQDLGRELLKVVLIALFVVAAVKGLDAMKIANLLR